MALVPRAARPKVILRRTAIRRGGGKGGNVFWQALAVYFVGGRPMVRSRAIRGGVLGGKRAWQAILLGVMLRNEFVRKPQVITTEKLKVGQFINVRVAKPLSAKQQKRTGITRKALELQALADVAAAKGTQSAT